MPAIDLDDPPVPLSLRDALEESDLIYGEDRNAPLGDDDKELAWKGEAIDGYPARERSVEEIRRRRKDARSRMAFDKVAARELIQVPPGGEAVRTYVARIRAAQRMGLHPDAMHEAYYEGQRPESLATLAEMGFGKEARWAMAGRYCNRCGGPSMGQETCAACLTPEERKVPVERSSPRDSFIAEGVRRGQRGGIARGYDLLSTAEILTAGLDDGMGSNLAQNDKVKNGDNGETGTVNDVDPDGSVTVTLDSGGTEKRDPDAVKGLQRVQAAARTANQPGRPDQHHAPKGTRSPGKKGEKDTDVGEATPMEPEFDEKALRMAAAAPGGIELLPDVVETFVVRWPNLAALNGALPKLAGPSWLDGIDIEVKRRLGSWQPDMQAYELEASFPIRDAARTFARHLVDERQVHQAAVSGRVERDEQRFLRAGSIRVDTVRRILFPGGVVFAIEGSPPASSFQLGDQVLVADTYTNQLAEAKVAAVGPDVVVVTAADGTQFEYGRGTLQRLHLARLNLEHARPGILARGQTVKVGGRTGELMDFDRGQVRVHLAGDPPRWFDRDEVSALVRIAFLPRVGA